MFCIYSVFISYLKAFPEQVWYVEGGLNLDKSNIRETSFQNCMQLPSKPYAAFIREYYSLSSDPKWKNVSCAIVGGKRCAVPELKLPILIA